MFKKRPLDPRNNRPIMSLLRIGGKVFVYFVKNLVVQFLMHNMGSITEDRLLLSSNSRSLVGSLIPWMMLGINP